MSYQREYEAKLKVAIIGIGSHAYRNILPTLNYLPVTVKALCDINENLVKATAAQYGNCNYYINTKEMYEKEELDAVFICVHPSLHPKLACEAFDEGVNVWLEKPVAMRASEVEQMIAKRKDRIAVVGFKKAFMPSTDKAIEIVNSPKYGGLKTMLAVYPMDIPENDQEVLNDRLFTNWLANGVHPLSLLLTVGGKVSSVTTHRGTKGGGVCLLEFENGTLCNFHMASGPQPIESYKFFGDNWHLSIENSSKVILQRGIPFDYGRTTSFVPAGDDSGAVVWEAQNCLATLENKALFIQGMYAEMKYFCDCVLLNQPAERGSLEFALHLMKVYEAALISHATRIEI
jgi:predicted dehydrogenase